MSAPSNPFQGTTRNPFTGELAQWVTVTDRLKCVRSFDLAQCRDALQLPNLQASVKAAIERRIRKLERGRHET